MFRLDRNNFILNPKNSTIYTPTHVSRFLFELVREKISNTGVILDPSVGKGSLLIPFDEAGFKTIGIDIKEQGYPNTIARDFLSFKKDEIDTPSLVIVNPPFNINDETKKLIIGRYKGRPLFSEIWLRKIVELWGIDVPTILYGFRLSQTTRSKRWRAFREGLYPPIMAIITLPFNVFKGILFQSEILVFNISGLKAHYFCDDNPEETFTFNK